MSKKIDHTRLYSRAHEKMWNCASMYSVSKGARIYWEKKMPTNLIKHEFLRLGLTFRANIFQNWFCFVFLKFVQKTWRTAALRRFQWREPRLWQGLNFRTRAHARNKRKECPRSFSRTHYRSNFSRSLLYSVSRFFFFGNDCCSSRGKLLFFSRYVKERAWNAPIKLAVTWFYDFFSTLIRLLYPTLYGWSSITWSRSSIIHVRIYRFERG